MYKHLAIRGRRRTSAIADFRQTEIWEPSSQDLGYGEKPTSSREARSARRGCRTGSKKTFED